MSLKRFKKSGPVTTDRWSGPGAAAVAAAAVHYTAPWYYALGPVVVIAIGFALRRSRRGGSGPRGQGPSDGP